METRISSSSKVPYDLRPRKQIERRMMGHTLQLIAEAGFPISTFRYAGFGAFFFVDFILFRRLLGIQNMVSIEHDTSRKKRVFFNRPFNDIEIKHQSSLDYISELSADLPHILWLDYDGPLCQEHIEDIQISASKLCSSSILITTFDVDFDKADEVKNECPKNRKSVWFERFSRECGRFFDPLWTKQSFAARYIIQRTTDVVEAAILDGINMRDEISFEPIFNFEYADGHRMMTYGGMIVSKSDKRKLRQVEWADLPFTRRKLSTKPFLIDFPVFTRKERLFIDSEMPCEDKWTPDDFELDREEIEKYSKVYRYSPSYAELFL